MRRSSRSGSRLCNPRAMLLASSLISVEKRSGDAGVAGNPKKADRWAVKHRIVAFILTVIRPAPPKRRTRTARAYPAYMPCIFNTMQRIVHFSTAERRVSVRDFSYMAALSGRLARIARLAAPLVLLVLPALAQAQESSDRQDQ